MTTITTETDAEYVQRVGAKILALIQTDLKAARAEQAKRDAEKNFVPYIADDDGCQFWVSRPDDKQT